MVERTLYDQITIKIFVPKDKLPDTLEDEDPFEEAVENMVDAISTIEWEGLSYHEGVQLEIDP